MMIIVPDLSRRAALRLGAGAIAGAAGIWSFGALVDPERVPADPGPLEPPAPLPPAPPVAAPAPLPTKVAGSFVSAARGGVLTNYIIARPPGITGPLRPVIALHGVRGSAKQVMSFGVEQALAELAKAGRPPIAVVAVDGGDTYWHRRAGGEDAGSMVLNELIPMLATMSLDITRIGFMGWSMGGYGAMLLGSRLGPARTAGICAVSPALYQSYTASTLGAFDSYDDWTRNTVFGLPALNQIPLRVDCGNEDRFAPAAHQFVSQLRTPPAGGFSPGGHDEVYWRQQLPAELAWLAS
ncbi:alpha/beta hydrolase-fold protein [Candidatus Mycobacterium wuenschmannii]|uniref:Acyl-CoA:diacylglycerol acyltransferase n=1 Tax=Candidatus Mycobacterium wuenschmannii TaxID=3027808 RepID=A0ABY8VVL3_9MYCO|nr:alpha/beta hydrolase-fold protein [Candidatus Mycobacterium wuenschmannii]WIM87346.1 alpha/beta hydrolase-fold protein [Candidatus Mycobacterium wuenschmannii]